MIKDDTESHLKLLATAGLIAVSLAMGYSMGLNHALDSPANAIKSGPTDPESIVLLEQAGQRARAAGDAKMAEWLEQASVAGRERFFAWASAQAHGQKDGRADSSAPRLHAGAR